MGRLAHIIIILLSTTFWAGEASAKKADPLTDRQFLFKALVDIEYGYMSSSDIRKLQKLSQHKSEVVREEATVLLARYLDEAGQPWIALNQLAAKVLDKETLKTWKALKLRPKKTPKGEIFNPQFPAVSKWQLDNAEACITTAKVLASFKQYDQALEGFDTVGRQKQDLPQVMAAEGGADLLVHFKRYEKAISFYEFALKVVGFLLDEEEYQEMDPDKKLIWVKSRIEKKLAKAKELLDIERYGPGFVQYRKARKFQLKDGNMIRAVDAFNTLENDYSGTVYSEAAVLYRSQVLLKLDDLKRQAKAKSHIAKLSKALSSETMKFNSKKKKMLKTAREAKEAELAHRKALVDRLKAIKLATTQKEALKDLEAFIRTEEGMGLYRGEAMVVLASHYMDEYEPDKALPVLERCTKWFDKVKALDAKLESFEVPSKAASVSAPPTAPYRFDKFNNMYRVSFEPSQVINRLTEGQWYLSDLRAKAHRHLGFIRFYQGNMEAAKTEWDTMKKYDIVNNEHESRGDWGDYNRLMWGVKHGYFYARPEELAQFKGRQRFAALMGDYFYITERWQETLELHQRLLRGELGTLSSTARGYCIYFQGQAYYWQDKRLDALNQWKKVFLTDKKSYTAHRAMLAAGNLATTLAYRDKLKGPDLEAQRELGIGYLSTVTKTSPYPDLRYSALISLAVTYNKIGKTAEAIQLLDSVPDKQEKYYKLAKSYLKLFNEKREVQ